MGNDKGAHYRAWKCDTLTLYFAGFAAEFEHPTR
jgi:hypothetical protein